MRSLNIIIISLLAYFFASQEKDIPKIQTQANTEFVSEFIKNNFERLQESRILATQGNLFRYYLSNSIESLYSGSKADPNFHIRKDYMYLNITEDLLLFDIIIITKNSDFSSDNFNFLSTKGYNLLSVKETKIFYKKAH